MPRDYVRQLPDSSTALAQRPSGFTRWHIDPVLLLLLITLSGFGLLVLYSASGSDTGLIRRQVTFLLLGTATMVVAAQIGLDRYRRWVPLFYLLGLVLLVLVMVAGTGAKGAQRWLSVGGFRFQPSEIMKLTVPLTLAAFLAARGLPPRLLHVGAALALIAVPALLIGQQPDLGTALLITMSGLFVLFMAGMSWRLIIGTVILALASIWPLWQYVMRDYQRQRVLTLLSPESDKLGAGWNIIQSKTAIGSGGWEGKGWLQGTQSRLDFLPESHTDFIIAVLAEEFGLRGVMILLSLYFLLILRGLWISINARDTFSRLLAGSVTLTFFVYLFVNMGMVSGLLPVVGVPLPLVSAGGTSLVTLLAGFGLLMAVATDQRRPR
jgi:rod shape determining protein RodA